MIAASTAPDPLNAFTLAELRRRTSVKWTHYAPEVLPLWVAEMDAAPVPEVTQVVAQMLAAGDTGYPGRIPARRVVLGDPAISSGRESAPDYRSLPRYQDAYAAFAAQRWDLELDTDAMALMPDVMQGIAHAIRLAGVTNVAITTPVYPPFRSFPASVGARVTEAGMSPDGRLDFAELERIFPQVDGFLLCNPHNPSGVAHTREELARVLELAAAHSVRVIVDEIHAPMTSPARAAQLGRDPFTPILSVPGSEGVLVLFSAAKGFNLAGFKAAILVGGSATHDLIRAVPEVIADGSGTISLAAHTAALVYGGGWLDSVRAAVDARRAQFAQGLARIAPQAWVQPADATYFAWTNLAEVPVRDGNVLGGGTLLGDDPARLLLEQGQLAVNPGVSFGQGGEGFVRVNLATTPEVISEALARIEHALTC